MNKYIQKYLSKKNGNGYACARLECCWLVINDQRVTQNNVRTIWNVKKKKEKEKYEKPCDKFPRNCLGVCPIERFEISIGEICTRLGKDEVKR